MLTVHNIYGVNNKESIRLEYKGKIVNIFVATSLRLPVSGNKSVMLNKVLTYKTFQNETQRINYVKACRKADKLTCCQYLADNDLLTSTGRLWFALYNKEI